MLITAPATQLVTGISIDESRCSRCKTSLEDGVPVGAYAVQYAGDDAWSIPRLYYEGCRPDAISTAALGMTQLLVAGRLATTMDTTIQRTMRTMMAVDLVAISQPEVGDV